MVRTETTYVPEADGSMTRPESHGFVVSRAYARLRPSDLSTGAPPERRSLEEPGTSIELSVADIVEDHAQVVNPTAQYLLDRRHSRDGILQYLQSIEHLGTWLGSQGIPTASLDERVVELFLKE